MSGSGLDDIFNGGGSGGAPAAQPTPTSGAYTQANFPYKDFAEFVDFDYGKHMNDPDEAALWKQYVESGSKWVPGGTLEGPAVKTTIPPFMPGNQSAIAQQLGLGYGVPASDFMQSPLSQLFQPMTLSPTFTPPKTTKTKDDDRRR